MEMYNGALIVLHNGLLAKVALVVACRSDALTHLQAFAAVDFYFALQTK